MAAMTTMLAGTAMVEESKRTETPSIIREEILVLLRRPASFQVAIKEIRNELFPLFSKLEISAGIIDLLEDDLVHATYTSGYEPGVEQAEGSTVEFEKCRRLFQARS